MQVQWIKHFIYLPTPRIEDYQPVWSAKKKKIIKNNKSNNRNKNKTKKTYKHK